MKGFDQPYIISLCEKGEPETGYVTIAEHHELIPFEVKRTFWTYNTPESHTRGNHAHKTTQELLVCVNGSITVETSNTEGNTVSFVLDNPQKALYLPPFVWRTIRYSNGAVLLVMASTVYDKSDYLMNQKKWLAYYTAEKQMAEG
ncbi:FdtA/QdtA family cupin domain-containing protein [Limibacter armeniacum]|uniref:sugar 3,4-ketoisomerase n=1 Tax=Limibacter armeniacum TaxID=466084 RepID=UPI002FE50E11